MMIKSNYNRFIQKRIVSSLSLNLLKGLLNKVEKILLSYLFI